MDEKHPAMIAARTSWRCVHAHDRTGWLDLMAEDICIEDPIGVGPTNPTGQGARGKDEVGAFWDQNIGPSTIRITPRHSRTAGSESAHLLTLQMILADGTVCTVEGIFVYRVNEAGKLQSMRGYWTIDDMTIEQPD